MKTNRSLLGAAILVSTAAALGCGIVPGKVTGGGTILSTDGVHKANFGFNGQQCDLSRPVQGQLTYQDKNAPGYGDKGVKLHAEVISTDDCGPVAHSPLCDLCGLESGYVVGISYTSQNPDFPEPGEGIVCTYDAGEGANAPEDIVAIVLYGGSFSGYANGYQPVQGNIQSHACD